MTCRRKLNIFIALLVTLLLVCAFLPVKEEADTASHRIYVTAAHVGAVAGYECVYVDEENDYAIHLHTEFQPALPLDAEVTLAGTTGTVYAMSNTEFTVTVSDISCIVPGVSGTPVCYDAEPIGFISGWDGEGHLRCIFY